MKQSLWKKLPRPIQWVLLGGIGGIGATCACLILLVVLVGGKSTAKLPPTAMPPQRSASMALVALEVTDVPTATAPPTAPPTNTPEPTTTSIPTATPVPPTETPKPSTATPEPPTATPDPAQATVHVQVQTYRKPSISAGSGPGLCPESVLHVIEQQRVNAVVWYHVQVVRPGAGCGGGTVGLDGWLFASAIDAPQGLAVAELPPVVPTEVPTEQPIYVAPAPAAPASGGIVCRDGSISHAAHRQGACSHHGGIAP